MAGEAADLVAESVLASVFGLKNIKRTIRYNGEG